MSDRRDLLDRADLLEAEARTLRKKAHDTRPLPERWEVGHKVRFIKDIEWGPCAGDVLEIMEVEHPERPAGEYQVFFTGPAWGGGRYFTTPDDVEWVEG